MKRKVYVYDIETLPNVFVAVFIDLYSEHKRIFVVSEFASNYEDFMKFLHEEKTNKTWLFGFNNLNFDSQIIEYILKYENKLQHYQPREFAKIIYNYSQSLINRQENSNIDFKEEDLSFVNVDIYRLNNWSSKARHASLKWIQYNMDWHNVEEMPFEHTHYIEDKKELRTLIDYCINDVESTKAIYLLKDDSGKFVMLDQINLRIKLAAQYHRSLLSGSEPKISKRIFEHHIAEKMNISKEELRKLKTIRKQIVVKDIIFDNVQLTKPEFKVVKDWYETLILKNKDFQDEEETEEDNKKYKKRIVIDNCIIDYSLGGVHGVRKGIYHSNDDYIIKSCDVKSYYPNLAMKNKLHPAHIPVEVFTEIYEWFYKQRDLYPKGDLLNYLFKIILNATFGLTKDKYSVLYDPQMTAQICINGQLELSMLADMLFNEIPDIQPVMFNTDGCEMYLHKRYLDKYDKVCRAWEEKTKLTLEYDDYLHLYAWDVNNYIAINTKKKHKCKGRFEFENLQLHKNKSFLVIPKAVFEFFVNNISPEDYVKTNNNIFDYCAGVRTSGDWEIYKSYMQNSEYKEQRLGKIVRYYVSQRGDKLFKRSKQGGDVIIDSGPWYHTIFNRYEAKPFKEYNLDLNYYIAQASKEITSLDNKQYKLLL